MPEPDVAAAVARLDELTRRLRRECPWDREQDERSIVPHTVEEAYELADAANARRRRQAARRARRRALPGPLPLAAARGARRRRPGAGRRALRQKLIRRHPHVFGEVEAETAGEVLRNWDAIKRAEPGPRGRGSSARCPRTSRRCCTRARSSAARPARASTSTGVPYDAVSGELEELEAARHRPRRGLPRGRRRALRRRQRRAQAARRPRARAARGERALPRARRGRRASSPRSAGADWDGADPRRQARLLRPSEVERP